MSLLPVADALARVLALVRPTEPEEVALPDAGGRVLAADIAAGRDQPPFAASAMDGYAVRSADAKAGAVLEVIAEAAAGHAVDVALRPRTAVRIFTGAPVPPGADAVLIQENAVREGANVRVDEAPEPGRFIRPAGGDFPKGFRVAAPARLGPRHIALIAAMNVPRVVVRRRPVVALIPTGDELVEPGADPRPDQIVTSNNYGLAAMVRAAGGVPLLCPIARDSRESLFTALDAAAGADFVVTLGGASVGDHDLVASVLGEAGLELDFYRIAMRPGKPLMAGRLGARVMLGLPGNPVSAMVCGELFLRPALDAALGLPAGPRRRSTARLTRDLPANGPREHYMRAEITTTAEGFLCNPFADQDSSLLRVLAAADALAVRPPHAPPAAAGDPIEIILLDQTGR